MGNVVETGDKLHIMTRRLFEDDLRRHFVGEVISSTDSLVEVRGYTFILDSGTNEYTRLPGERTRLFSLGEAGHIVNKIPKDVELSAISYQNRDNRLVVTDGGSFSLAINEFGSGR